MNKEQIEKRIAELKSKLDQLNNNGNALVGAIQDCEYWLAKVNKEATLPDSIAGSAERQGSEHS